MRYLRRHWYDIGVYIGLACLIGLVLFWNSFTVLQRLLFANFAVMFFHFFEEFGFPGGFGKMCNTILFKDSPTPDRWPLNQNNAMIGNWFFAFAFYLPPVFFPDVIWLGLMPVLFGIIVQGIGHLFVMNYLLRTWFNAGMITTVVGFIPIGFYYIHYIVEQNLFTVRDLVIAWVFMVLAYGIVFRRLVIMGLADKNSPYPFDTVEMARFDQLYGVKSR